MKSTIAVFCGANNGLKLEYTRAAYELAETLVAANYTVVYGGGKVGMMGVLADRILALGGDIIGVIPDFLCIRELAHPEVKNMHRVKSMLERKEVIAQLSDCFLMLPGGIGTLDEFFDVLALSQLDQHSKPCAILNTANYFDLLIGFMDKMTQEQFYNEQCKQNIIIDKCPTALIAQLNTYKLSA